MSRAAADFCVDAAAGTVGGVIGVLTGSPLDVLKTRLQAGSAALGTHATGARLSALQVLRAAVRQDGIRSLYRGSLVASLGQAPNNALTFGVYGASIRYFTAGGHVDSASLWQVAAAGVASGFVQSIALAPFEHVKVQQQLASSHGGNVSMLHVTRLLLRAGITRGLMRGWVATAWRDAPTYGVYFASYEGTKRAYARWQQRQDELLEWSLQGGAHAPSVSPPDSADKPRARVRESAHVSTANTPMAVLLLGGALAGTTSWTLALPFDVMKSMIQGAPLSTPASSLRLSVLVRVITHTHGAAGFMQGWGPCVLRAAPVNAITFLVYDWSLTWLQREVHASSWYSSLQ